MSAKKPAPSLPPKPERKTSILGSLTKRLSFSKGSSAPAAGPASAPVPLANANPEEERVRIVSQAYDIEALRAQLVKEEKEKVWVPTKPTWSLGEVVAISKDQVRVTVQLEDGTVSAFLRDEVRGFDAAHLDPKVFDLGTLNDLNEAAVLSVLSLRFKKQDVYTGLGEVLLSVNPYQTVSKPEEPGRPTINNTTRVALEHVRSGKGATSILVNGDSGAGKTEATKIAMRLLVSGKAASSESAEVRRAIAQVTPLLEAFGNARTLQNKNSSRFGKFSELMFASGEISGSRVRTFLLESGRAVARAPGERNFHVFYQLCAGLDAKTKAAWGVQSDPNKHAYLAGYVEDGEDEEAPARFLATSAAMEAMGLSEQQRKGVFCAVALVLRLGDVTFGQVAIANSDPGSKLASGGKELAAILGLPLEEIERLLCSRSITSGGSGANRSTIEIQMTPVQAHDSRDALAKMIYAGMFNMVVEAANKGCASAKTHSSYIGVLDMMGFEVLKDNNSFEQLLINSASEELQAVFNSSLVQSERRAYSDEGVDSSKLDLKDNRALLNMFRTELFPFLDEFTSLATGTDALFLQKLGGSKAEDVCLDPLVDGFFVIKHFAGPVSYSGAGLLEKNKAAVFGSMYEVLIKTSAQPFCTVAADVFALGNSGGKLATMVPSVSKKFRQGMDEMMASISKTTPFFVRCVKPNAKMSATEFDPELVYDQLLRLGVFEAVRLRREGFPLRLPFAEICKAFPLLATSGKTDKEKAECILVEGLGEAARGRIWQLGQSSAFLGPRALIEVGKEVRKRETEADLRRRLEEKRLADEARRAADAKAQEEVRLKREQDVERQRLEQQAKDEEAKKRKKEMEIEAKRAAAERLMRAGAATAIEKAARYLARRRFKNRRKKASTRIQALARMRLVRLRFDKLREQTKPWAKGLRKGEVVLLSSLVVRVQVHEMIRAMDEIVGAKGKVVDQAKKVDKAVSESLFQAVVGGFTNQKKRYGLLLVRGKGGCSLVLMDPATFEIKDELRLEKHNPVKAMSTTTRDFVLQKGEDTWVLTDLLGGAVGWVNLLKQDIPTFVQLLKPGGKSLALRGAEIVVKQGYLNLKRGEQKKWDKRWFVLEQGAVKWFKGQKNTLPTGQLIINEYSEVKVPRGEDGKAFVIHLKTFEESIKVQCANPSEFQEWLAAFSIAVDLKKKNSEEERGQLSDALASGGKDGNKDRKELVKSMAVRDSAALTAKLGQGKGGKFDAGAFKQAFKERDVVNTANW